MILNVGPTNMQSSYFEQKGKSQCKSAKEKDECFCNTFIKYSKVYENK